MSFLAERVHEISCVTTIEYATIWATLSALDNAEYNCERCLSKYAHRKDGAEMTAKVREIKGCREIKAIAVHKLSDDLAFKTCPGNYYRPWVLHWLEASKFFERGTLPFPGALSEQPNKAVEIFRVIESFKAEKAREEQAKAEKKRRLNG